MILMVSGRTDIVAFYSKWFMNRYRAGFWDVRNPFNPKLVSRIYLEDVDAIMFCTKNPIPIIPYLKEIKKPILFHITLTPYQKDIEPNVISKGLIIDGIKKISDIIGPQNTIVRYDPILINNNYTIEYHIKAFESLCSKLKGYIKTIIISFVDDYKNVRNNMNILKYQTLNKDDYYKLSVFNDIASKYGMMVQTCYEDLEEYGFNKGECLSKELAYNLTGKKFKKWQARKCGCVEMVDIGAYNTCNHLCRYCYANYDEDRVKTNVMLHNPCSSLLIGELKEDDEIKRRV